MISSAWIKYKKCFKYFKLVKYTLHLFCFINLLTCIAPKTCWFTKRRNLLTNQSFDNFQVSEWPEVRVALNLRRNRSFSWIPPILFFPQIGVVNSLNPFFYVSKLALNAQHPWCLCFSYRRRKTYGIRWPFFRPLNLWRGQFCLTKRYQPHWTFKL